jgi:acyl-CoA thioesterase
MTVYFHVGRAQLQESGSGYLLGQATGQGFASGYFDHAAQLWNETGTLMATTHQVYYFKE